MPIEEKRDHLEYFLYTNTYQLLNGKMSQGTGIQQNRSTAIVSVTTRILITIWVTLMTKIMMNLEAVPVTKDILNAKNTHTINDVITTIAIMMATGVFNIAVGSPGTDGNCL